MGNSWLESLSPQPYVPQASAIGAASPTKRVATDGGAASFANVLQQKVQEQSNVRFSAHAMSRMQERGMVLSGTDVQRLGAAMDEARQKGARDAYMVLGDAGFVVNVPNRTVVTAMTHGSGTVVTNIDSVVFVSRLDR